MSELKKKKKKCRNQQSLNNDRKKYFLDLNLALRKHFLKILANLIL